MTSSFPWRRPRRERLIILLVAIAALTPVYTVSTQDVSRLCLTHALAAGRVTVSPCIGHTLDHARYRGNLYSDKAPGMSLLALPSAALAGFPGSARAESHHDLGVWGVRVLTSGIAFVLLVFALGRVAEGLAEDTGAPVAVTFALGTLSGSLAATMFDQVTAAALCFGAFLLAWRARPGLAGLLAGTAVLVEYESTPLVVIVTVYLALTGARRLQRYCLGAVPPLAVLAAYDWVAFGSPLHASYRYVANGFARKQASGFFGISYPTWHSVTHVLVGNRGLLAVSPVLAAAAAGLALLARRHGREAAVCASAVVAGLVVEAGYFLPYGGISPGPRFLVPCLPFLAVGLAPAFKRARAVTSLLAAASVTASTATLLTWPEEGLTGYRGTVWRQIAGAITHAHSTLQAALTQTLFEHAGLGRSAGASLVAASAAAASTAALTASAQDRARTSGPDSSGGGERSGITPGSGPNGSLPTRAPA